ncbi:hypothetical protein EUU23_08110 [Sphingorhabdus sp. IMCC26285]|jgi:hypothetical protein|uniref:Uncharacterized protein n=1 Tax=Sphingorhabdus profundilacus TaxID=2509718 RepID=A0A6I4LXQ4_9SPHN|nr:hypothetical protein [Sphingorhabdus profundilacus]MVZ97669.1 hypothetical protein [Sphingorhabdus profundilacus]
MTLSQVSSRIGALAAASVISATLLFVAPQAHAASSGPYYKVELAQPAASKQELLRSVFVKCEGTACRAPMASTAPKNMCISISREFGQVSAFSAGDRVFTAEEIAACNGNQKEVIAKN